MAYWDSGFYFTRHGAWKVFWWAITKSEHGIEDCLFSFQRPWQMCYWGRKRRLVAQLPIKIHIPTYLIIECGEKAVGVKDWDIPF